MQKRNHHQLFFNLTRRIHKNHILKYFFVYKLLWYD